MVQDRSSELTSQLSEVSAALAQPFYRLRFDRFLELQFEQASQPGRIRSLRIVLVCGAAIQVSLFIFGAVLSPATVLLFSVPSVAVVVACLLGAALLKRDRPIWLQNASAIAPTVAFIAAETFKGVCALPAFSDRMLVTTGLMACLANLIVPMRFQAAVLYSALGFFAFAGILLGDVGHPPPNQIPTVMFSGGAILFSLVIAWRHELSGRQAFLLGYRAMILSTELSRLARTDPLTGLANRRVFDESLSSACQAASAGWVGLIMVDIDHFKSFNDTVGHAEGDRCLRSVAESLGASMRASDTLARFGGEEFAVILPDTYPDDSLHVAARLRAAVDQLGLPHPVHGAVTVSVGVAAVQTQQTKWMPAALLKAADDALYRAKQNGRNRVVQAEVQAQRPASIVRGAVELIATGQERPATHPAPAARTA